MTGPDEPADAPPGDPNSDAAGDAAARAATIVARSRVELAGAETVLTEALAGERGRRRGEMVRERHRIRRMLDPGYLYTSQAGQDRVVDRLLNGRRDGIFADIGGYDGVTGSNSLFFEAFRGWTGILVEPVSAQRAVAEAQRRCPCLPYAVAATEGEAAFLEVTGGYTQMSGLADQYDPALLREVRRDPRHAERTVSVETRTLSRILTEAGVEHPDFVSLDIEGAEVTVLADFPFPRHCIGVWAIENNSADPLVRRIMESAGYVLAEFCGPDEIWRKRDL